MMKAAYIMAKSEAIHIKASAKGKGNIRPSVHCIRMEAPLEYKGSTKYENCFMAFCT
jgi:hypothetical protein